MIIELKTFEDMTLAEQRQHLLDILVDGNGDVDLEEVRKVFLQRIRQPKNDKRTYFTCKELAELVGRSADTIRKMFINEKAGVLKTLVPVAIERHIERYSSHERQRSGGFQIWQSNTVYFCETPATSALGLSPMTGLYELSTTRLRAKIPRCRFGLRLAFGSS